jgi:hypothetical protein
MTIVGHWDRDAHKETMVKVGVPNACLQKIEGYTSAGIQFKTTIHKGD